MRQRGCKVSVILPVFNERPEFLELAVRSLLEQTHQDFELLVLDDGSDEPSTIDTLRRIEKSDGRIRLHHHPNMGLTRTLNAAIALANGEIIVRHDSDDWSEPDRIEKQLHFLGQNPQLGVVGTFYWLHQEDGTPLWVCDLPVDTVAVMAAFPRINPFAHGATCFRKNAAQVVGGYRVMCDACEDYDFFWRICERFGGANLPEALYHQRRTGASVMTTRAEQNWASVMLAQELARMRQRGDPEDFDAATEAVKKVQRTGDVRFRATLNAAYQNLLAGHYSRSFILCLTVMKSFPRRPLAYLSFCHICFFVCTPPSMRRLSKKVWKALHLFVRRATEFFTNACAIRDDKKQ